jgi:predicted phage-related endonuclease
MTVHVVNQRSDEWRRLRAGRLTGSRAGAILATLKGGGEPASRRNLRTQLVLERLTQTPQDGDYVSPAMQYGIDREDDARAAYEAETGSVVTPCGFVTHDTLAAGCSPDGVVGDFTGLIELKCCNSATHLEFLRTNTLPAEHRAQVLHGLWVTGASWCDYVSFDDRFPADLAVRIVRIQRVPGDVAAYELNVRMFFDEVEKELALVQGLQRQAVAV